MRLKIGKRPGPRYEEAPGPGLHESPVRFELLNLDQLQSHARELARWQRVDPRGGRNELLGRLAANERRLVEVYDLVAETATKGGHISPAAAWLVDNFYLIEQQVRIARLHLPRSYGRQLPRLLNEGVGRRPRVYDMAFELIVHVDGRVDADGATSFVAAYQSVAPLKLGELWAFPIMLRLALLENLARIATRVGLRHRHHELGSSWAERLIQVAAEQPHSLIQVLADLDRTQPPLSSAFVQEFRSRLQGRGTALEIVLSWIDHRLAEQGVTAEDLARADSHEEAADQVSVANCVASLRFLGAADWRAFVESLSLTELALRRDPAGVYATQEFETRDRSRHVVEAIAVHSRMSEEEVARQAVALAETARPAPTEDRRTSHVGYYLLDKGRRTLEKKAGRRGLFSHPVKPGLRLRLAFYLGSVAAISAGGSYLAVLAARSSGIGGPMLWFLAASAFVAGSSAGVSLVNLAAIRLTRPRLLPRLDFSGGIPEAHRTVVVVPHLLNDGSEAAKLLEDLEIRYLGNRDRNLYFALITDFPDAPGASMPGDNELLARVRDGIGALNAKYAAEDGRREVFFHFHRRRVWNPYEGVWMGYERKRGKLEQFNALLRGGSEEPFLSIIADRSILPTIRYVICLDRDTHLPRGAGARLAATIAHPLNRPVFDEKKGRVVAGYGILQPRVSVTLTAATRSIFAHLAAGDYGIDPYTREVSDVYQDLFGEGSFTGKGIYDVDAFMRATAGRFPENLILSHDLIEGCYARSALVTDVEIVEEHPASYAAEASRRHRWTRGDWQISGWLLPRARGRSGRRVRNFLSLLSRWKIADNLRRSLVPAALLALSAGGLIAAARLPFLWTLLTLGMAFAGPVVTSALDILLPPSAGRWGARLSTTAGAALQRLALTALDLVLLPYDAFIRLSSIVRSGLRLPFFRITRRGFLLWYSAAYARMDGTRGPWGFWREMWAETAAAAAMALALAFVRPGSLPAGACFLAAWLAGPFIGWWVSRPRVSASPRLSETQRLFLRSVARLTWRYFSKCVGPETNGLAPDNFQEVPEPRLAFRTSPTNLGMNVQANMAALDLGYISQGQFLDRTEAALAAMAKLERFRGHFYNWYDVKTLKPLKPRYVSSVDSGNLLASLMMLRSGLAEIETRPLVREETISGLRDMVEAIAARTASFPQHGVRLLDALRGLTPAAVPGSIPGAIGLMDEIRSRAAALAETLDSQDEARDMARELEAQALDAKEDLLRLAPDPASVAGNPSLRELSKGPGDSTEAVARLQRIAALDRRAVEMEDMNFEFLYDRERDLLAIGHRVEDRRNDPSYYDLLASEARLASFVLIAKGAVPQRHWFALSRLLTKADGGLALLSWSGSMFEYLMPLIWMPMFEHTLLYQTYRSAVARHRDYGRRRGVPWGISESCYNAVDADANYQYGAFGVPGLGFKRDLGEDLVVAPYASALALMVSPEEACRNLQRMAATGFLGRFGFYESADYTASRLPPGSPFALIRTFMTHHQGMSLLALENILRDGAVQRRFIGEPSLRATELLLQERIPAAGPSLQPHEGAVRAAVEAAREPEAGASLRIFRGPITPSPEVHLLSNGSYHVMTTASGGGYSLWRDLALTRWREDPTSEAWGTFIYLRDLDSGRTWSSGYLPTKAPPESYETVFAPARTEIRRRDTAFDTLTEICVSPEDDVEIRRVRLTNLSDRPRRVEVTSYAEVVLDAPAADLAHRVFNNLFVQTQIVRDREALLCRRRKRRPEDRPSWMLHFITAPGTGNAPSSYETDREKFIGRLRTPENPVALERPGGGSGERPELSGSEGAVLDPIVAMRRTLEIEPDGTALVHIVTGAAETRQAATALIDKYREPRFIERAFEMAWSHNQVQLHGLGANEAEARAFERLASSLLFSGAVHRSAPGLIARNKLGQQGLWRFGISGDLPISLVRIGRTERLDLVRDALKAHAFWRTRGLASDMIVLNEDFSGYRQSLQEAILRVARAGPEAHLLDKPGGIFVRRGEELSEEERSLFQAAARVVLNDTGGTLAEQAEGRVPPLRLPPPFRPSRREAPQPPQALGPRELILGNGLGGFTADGREYVTLLETGKITPAPWANVIASPGIGTVVSESGSAYTWVENAHEFRLSTWHNDPLSDPPSEALYLRDEETGRFWSPAPLPAPGTSGYVCRHGFGYSVFEHDEEGLASELWTYVAVDAPIKFDVVRLRNHSGRKRTVTLAGYRELAMGEGRHLNEMHIATGVDRQTGALFAHNPFAREFAGRTLFAAASEAGRSLSGHRTEFIGRNGSLRAPAALRRSRLSGTTGAGLDPCAAISAAFDLADGEERDIVTVFGAGRDDEDARRIVGAFAGPGAAREALRAVWDRWNRLLGAIHVETPDPAFDVLVNGWLPYEIVSCRMWGRSAFYQSSGAYGFRDQLQDAAAVLFFAPELARDQILRCAERQFREGDVLHWWHPPTGRGVRTHISDDSLWLPYVVSLYIRATGDAALLAERRPFLEGRPLDPGEEARYDIWQEAGEAGTIYEHCVRAVKHALNFGPHGLPLMGSGDWNDGMNLVGRAGRGESIWLAWFLFDVLGRFGDLAEARGDGEFARLCRDQAASLRQNIEDHAWDGRWYRRAYFDDGRPLGSASGVECRIDSLSQSWAVISGGAPPGRARQAMESAWEHLYDRGAGLFKLLDPPFDASDLEPGYIKGYPPGVRENGGHYSHAVAWAAMAFARLGDKERAWELFRILNPVGHGGSPEGMKTFRVEPYVVPADICSAPPHTGRGGWTWYTGSAGWTYRLAVETLLGLRLEAGKLSFEPLLPDTWEACRVHLRYGQTFYHVVYSPAKDKAGPPVKISLDGREIADAFISLLDDRVDHQVTVISAR